MDWQAFSENFHFLRPFFLAALPFGILLLYWVTRASSVSSNWKQAIDSNLLSHLIDSPDEQKQQRLPVVSLFIAWIIACLALAGPTWEQIKQPVIKKQDALIIVLDLSLSMYAEDQKPSRIVSAQRKIKDILEKRLEGLTALIVYSGDAHVVSPLTDDTDTIATMLPALEPGIMPKYGSNLEMAFVQAQALLNNAAIPKAQILLLTDDISVKRFDSAIQRLNRKNSLSIITFGTESGAPIPLNNGFYKDKQGNTVIAKLNWSDITKLAKKSGIKAVKSSFNDSDINQLLNDNFSEESEYESDRQFDLWEDRGHWLTLLLIPIVLLSFRRGWILLVLFIVLPENSYALEWKDLWQTKDQQAAQAFKNGDIETAAKTFEDTEWQAAANYKKGNYETALQGFSDNSARSLYNKANTLAKMGQYEEAIKTYDKALKMQNDFPDASFNKALVEKLLKDQQQNQQQNSDESNKDNNNEQQNPQDQNQDQNENQQQSQESQEQQQSQQDQSDSQNQQSDNEQQQDQSQENNDNKQQQNQSEQQEDAEEDQQQNQQQARQQESDENEDSEYPAQAMTEQTPLEKEQQQALQQWLRKIPDDPGQLLRNKFRYQYEKNKQQNELLDKESEKLW